MKIIDSFMNTRVEIDGKWFIAKPYGLNSIIGRIKDAYRVLTGKAIAVYFYQDINKK